MQPFELLDDCTQLFDQYRSLKRSVGVVWLAALGRSHVRHPRSLPTWSEVLRDSCISTAVLSPSDTMPLDRRSSLTLWAPKLE
jgi:hypothetical protein